MKICLVSFIVLFLSGCATSTLLRDSEYKYSESAFQFADPEKALQEFPKKEKNGFVTSVEKSWISLWTDEKDQKNLLKVARSLEDRKYISIQREAEYFFFNESEEGYIPAEHEIVAMHLISSMYFLKNQQWTEARVEAKKAAFFLQSFFSPEQKHFDDPALRLWLAGIWTALGEWDEAQVDLRRAYELNHNKALLAWLNQTSPPKEFSVVFEGAGPEVAWNFGTPYPTFTQRDKQPAYKITASTLPWFHRHELRNSLIRDQVLKSNYMAQYYGVKMSTGTEKTVGFVSANAVKATAITATVAIFAGGIYLLSVSGAGAGTGDIYAGIASAGLIVGSTLWEQGNRIASSFDRSAKEIETEGKENLKTYRYVRFLPSWISVTDSFEVNPQGRELVTKAPASSTKVHFIQQF